MGTGIDVGLTMEDGEQQVNQLPDYQMGSNFRKEEEEMQRGATAPAS